MATPAGTRPSALRPEATPAQLNGRPVDTGAALRRPDGSAVRVLVVEAEPTLADLLTMALRYEGWDVRTAGDESAAVRTAREFRPDAVVLDMKLPDLDGFQILHRVRAESADRRPREVVVPVLVAIALGAFT